MAEGLVNEYTETVSEIMDIQVFYKREIERIYIIDMK
jgi:hypothetical protein